VEKKLAENVEEAAEMTIPDTVKEAVELFVEVVHEGVEKAAAYVAPEWVEKLVELALKVEIEEAAEDTQALAENG